MIPGSSPGAASIPDGPAGGEAPPFWRGARWWGALVVLLVLAGAVRWRLLGVPLERDEGEYAVFGQLIRDGIAPYAQAVNMKLPGIYLVYAGIETLLGETIRGIHLGLLLANALGAVLVALLARRLLSCGAAGLAAAAAFLAFTLGPRLQGTWANAEQFLLPCVLGAGLALQAGLARERRGYVVLAGLLLGAGILVKQHGAFFALVAGIALVAWHLRRRERGRLVGDCIALVAATLVPYLLTLAWLAAAGVLPRFWFWTWTYARAYADRVPLAMAPEMLARRGGATLATAWGLVAVAGLGILLALLGKRTRAAGAALLLLALLSFAAVSVGFVYRPHYFQLLAPAVALGAGAAVAAARGGRAGRLVAGALVLAAVAQPLYQERALLFEATPDQVTARVYLGNAFQKMPEVGAFLAERVPPGQRFAVIGSEPELYFYADRRPATAYVYTYALMEDQPYARRMTTEMIDEIESADPDVLVVVYNGLSWLANESSDKTIWQWTATYLQNYRIAAVMVRGRSGPVLFRDEEARAIKAPRGSVVLEVYERKQP